MTKLFVYGTLKSGFYNHPVLGYGKTPSKFIGKAVTEPVYHLFSLGYYPGMTDVTDTPTPVKGEVWEVPDDVLAMLERMELGAGYVRKEAKVVGHKNVQVYIYPHKSKREPLTEWRNSHE